MAYKLLESHLPICIINHCIVPYLIPSDDEIKENHKNLQRQLHYMCSNVQHFSNPKAEIFKYKLYKYNHIFDAMDRFIVFSETLRQLRDGLEDGTAMVVI
jgi:hypothetical protein